MLVASASLNRAAALRTSEETQSCSGELGARCAPVGVCSWVTTSSAVCVEPARQSQERRPQTSVHERDLVVHETQRATSGEFARRLMASKIS